MPLRIATIAAMALYFLLAGCATQPSSSSISERETAAALDRILAGPHRSAVNRARDPFRHPKETLLFFGIRPDMRVVEVWPGGGWYTEILAPLLRDRGQLYVAHMNPNTGDYARNVTTAFNTKLAGNPDLYSKVAITTLAAPASAEIAPAGSIDMVLTFRNLHNWMMFGWQREAFESMFKALKPGGVLGIVEHRGNPAIPQDPKAASGYVNEEYAIGVIESVGFKLIDRSQINANPKDTKDYEKGVWTLPPDYADGEENRYRAIGESDRFTLKFVKPRQ